MIPMATIDGVMTLRKKGKKEKLPPTRSQYTRDPE